MIIVHYRPNKLMVYFRYTMTELMSVIYSKPHLTNIINSTPPVEIFEVNSFEEAKSYLCVKYEDRPRSLVYALDDLELYRVRYLSAIESALHPTDCDVDSMTLMMQYMGL